jgi:hypothetical protein
MLDDHRRKAVATVGDFSHRARLPLALLPRHQVILTKPLAHVAPLGWEHIALTGDYIWNGATPAPTSGRYAMSTRRSCRKSLSVQF